MNPLFALALLFSAGTVLAGESDLPRSLEQMSRAFQDGQEAVPVPPPPPAPPGAPAGVQGDFYRTITTLSSEIMEGRAPKSKGSRLAREYIIARMQAYGLEPGGEEAGFVQAVHKKIFGYTIGNNVVGYIRGRVKPDECVYVDAHYDHWGRAGGKLQPGANDNASGVAVMLETARRLSQDRPDRTVVFLAADNEEGALLPMLGGLKGASYQARHPFCARDRIKGSVVLDTVGGAFVPGLRPQLLLIGSESSPGTYGLARGLAERADSAPPIRQLGVYAIEPLGTWAPRADYAAYREIGVPFIFATSGLPAEYHSESDTIEKIDFGFMEQAGSAILDLVSGMASARFEGGAAENDETVDWEREAASVERIIGDVLELRDPPADKSSYLKTLAAERDRLRAVSGSARQNKDGVKKAVRKAVVTIMQMNGSLKLWEHVYRTYGVPDDEPAAK